MKTINLFFTGLLLCLITACGSKEPSPLVAQTERLNGELSELAENSPLFLGEASASYADGTICVDITICNPNITIDALTDPLLQFVVAKYMQLHSNDDLITTLNTLGKEKGTLSLTVKDAAGAEKVLVLPSATLKRLATAKPMDLHIADVRLAMLDIMDERCKEFCEAVHAESCELDYVASFAQYTFTFKQASNISNMTPPVLTGKFKGIINNVYVEYGDCSPLIEDMLQTLQIDGYRIIYTAGDKTVKATLPWRFLHTETPTTTKK